MSRVVHAISGKRGLADPPDALLRRVTDGSQGGGTPPLGPASTTAPLLRIVADPARRERQGGAKRLGHKSTVETPDTYSHLWPDYEDRTREAVDRVLGAGGGAEAIR